jgi:hypothetical protein
MPLIDQSLSQNEYQTMNATYPRSGQTITGNGAALKYFTFWLARGGTPGGIAVCKLYDHTGNWGSTGKPTGEALATSDALNLNDLSTTPGEVRFTFASPYTLVNGTHYAVSVEISGGSYSGSNYLRIYDNSNAATHAGNAVYYDTIWRFAPVDFYFKAEAADAAASIIPQIMATLRRRWTA